VAIACTTDKMFARLAEDAMGRPQLASSTLYGLKAKRLEKRQEVDTIVAEWAASMTRDEVMEKCNAAEVPVGPLNTVADIFADPHYKAREALVKVKDPDLGEVVMPGVFPKLSATPGQITHVGPALGNATTEVMMKILGLSAGDIEQLRKNRII
jgi:succinyl-CoA:(S)-malate CoA-transferase subunit A